MVEKRIDEELKQQLTDEERKRQFVESVERALGPIDRPDLFDLFVDEKRGRTTLPLPDKK